MAAAFKRPAIVAIAAIGRNRELGKDNELLWKIPDDLKRFKERTTGHPIILGRKTFESIVGYLGKPLPNRQNIVVTRDSGWSYEGVTTASSVQEAIDKAQMMDSEQVSIGGGAQIYEAALPYTDTLLLTIVDAEAEADSFFPDFADSFTAVSREDREHEGLKYAFVELQRPRV